MTIGVQDGFARLKNLAEALKVVVFVRPDVATGRQPASLMVATHQGRRVSLTADLMVLARQPHTHLANINTGIHPLADYLRGRSLLVSKGMVELEYELVDLSGRELLIDGIRIDQTNGAQVTVTLRDGQRTYQISLDDLEGTII